MYVARRTGGGRGVYELADTIDGVRPSDLYGQELVLRIGTADVPTGIELAEQGGKPRLRLLDQSNDAVQIHRQVAALLLLPKPIRADEAMGAGTPVLQNRTYAIETIEIKDLDSNGAQFAISLGNIIVRNSDSQLALDGELRLARVHALWSNLERFEGDVADLLDRHRDQVLAESLDAELEDIVETLVAYFGGADPMDVLDQVPTTLVAQLVTKPLLILTGPAGTGKSRGAIDLATWMDYGGRLSEDLEKSRVPPSTALAFAPVGADWTDPRALLGYRNPFGPARTDVNGRETHETYEITNVLMLLLRASHPKLRDQPHFIILDEMNLSHVERYFSTFLSIIEADRNVIGGNQVDLVSRSDVRLIADVLEDSGDSPVEGQATRYLAERGAGLSFPPNVYVIGTVNVDETTYMFSPKVLDRALVQELKAKDPAAYLNDPQKDDEFGGGEEVLGMFRADIDRRRRGLLNEDPLATLRATAVSLGLTDVEADALATDVEQTLQGLYKLLDPVGFAFGFRAVNEFVGFVERQLEARALFADEEPDWTRALDAAVLMKILPKLHGNRRTLGSSLEAVAGFLSGGSGPGASYELGGAVTVSIDEAEKLNSALSRSEAKARQLHRTLQATGYTTFIA